VPLYHLDEKTDLKAPVLVAAFDGWVDAGQAGTLAAEQLAQDAKVVATFDSDQIYDYRARRPTLDIINGTLMSLDWPQLQLRSASIDGRSLLVLSGPEPDYRWRELSTDVAALAKRLGVTSWVSLGAIPAAVAHTRSVPVLGTASVRGLLPDGVAQGPDGRLRVPSAAISVMELAASTAGIPSLGFYAQVPHYISAAYPAAAIELLNHVGRYLALEVPLGELPTKALATRSLIDAAAAADEQTKAYVERLEEMTDEAKLPTGDDLIEEIERYLRDGGRGGNGGGLPN
jgi:predicted ATP-grasp superfamily ATP-dependent carboligase